VSDWIWVVLIALFWGLGVSCGIAWQVHTFNRDVKPSLDEYDSAYQKHLKELYDLCNQRIARERDVKV